MKLTFRKAFKELETDEEREAFWAAYHYREKRRHAGFPIPLHKVEHLAKPFWVRVDFSDECWYLKGKDRRYYTTFSFESQSYAAHRLAYALTKNGCPARFICHKCDNPACVRPSHLFAGTAQDNVDDMMRKGRHGCHQPDYMHWKERRRLGLPQRRCLDPETQPA
jgi:hypothetical protein